MRLHPATGLSAVPRRPADDVLDRLAVVLRGVPPRLARAARRDTRRLLRDPALLDPDAGPSETALDAYCEVLIDLPPLDPDKPAAWRRAVRRAWPRALGLPLTVSGIVAASRAVGEAAGVSPDDLAEGCRTLRVRPLDANDHGAVARFVSGLNNAKDARAWHTYMRVGWGRALQASVAAADRARRRSCGRLTIGAEGGRRRRCGTHGCGHADCGPRQAALAGAESWPHAAALQVAGVRHLRLGLTVPRRRDWTPVEALVALDRCAAAVVRHLAVRLDCRLAARIVCERQADGWPEWILVLADIDGELIRRMTAEADAYRRQQQADPPPLTPDGLRGMVRASTDAGIRTADLWPDLNRDIQAAANKAAKRAGIRWDVTYLAPVYNLPGCWTDVHKSTQAVGHCWPRGLRRFRSTRGTRDGRVRAYGASGAAPSTRQAAMQQRRGAEDRADATAAAEAMADVTPVQAPATPGIPVGQGGRAPLQQRATAARTQADAAADAAATSAAEARDAERAAEAAWTAAAAADAQAEATAATAVAAEEARADEAEGDARTALASRLIAALLGRTASLAVEEATAAWVTAEATGRYADDSAVQAALDELTADRADRRARRLEQMAREAPARATLAALRARAEALLDGPLPLGRPPALTCR